MERGEERKKKRYKNAYKKGGHLRCSKRKGKKENLSNGPGKRGSSRGSKG